MRKLQRNNYTPRRNTIKYGMVISVNSLDKTRGGEYESPDDRLIEIVRWYLPERECKLLRRAYRFAAYAHRDQVRSSGEPYVLHPLETAIFLSGMRLDAPTLAAALLHDVVEDTDTTSVEIAQAFSVEIARMVEGVTKITQTGRKKTSKALQKLESLQKTLEATVSDPRVLLIKLADRLHNMRTLDAVKPEKRKRIAQETLAIYAPLATRLGIWRVKAEMESLALKALEPETHEEIIRELLQRVEAQTEMISNMIQLLKKSLRAADIEADVARLSSRLYSTYKAMKLQGRSAKEVQSSIALCVLVPSVKECYTAVGSIHGLWPPIPGKFDDYIVSPKENLYHSLHTSVVGPAGHKVKFRIRTYEMHRRAEYGVFSYWRDKDATLSDVRPEEQVIWLSHLAEWRQDARDLSGFTEPLHSDILPERLHVFTPKGDMLQFPVGATPLDLAFRIHTDVGYACRGGRINGTLRELNYRMRNGDQVEIITTEKKEPCYEWLDPHLGFHVTTRASAKIRRWFRRQPREAKIAAGRMLVERELAILGLPACALELARDLFDFEDMDEFFNAIGSTNLGGGEIAERILEAEYHAEHQDYVSPVELLDELTVRGTGSLKMVFDEDCMPNPGDPIVGVLTGENAVLVHRADCTEVLLAEAQRLIVLTWGKDIHKFFPTHIEILAFEREGLLRDISTIVAKAQVAMSEFHATTDKKANGARMTTTLEIYNPKQLMRILHQIDQLHNVMSVKRVVPETEMPCQG